jgi:hypothetical protein
MTFNTPGTYYWYASYSGDTGNSPSISACEQLIVNPAPSVPQFPLGLALLFAVMVPALLVLRKGTLLLRSPRV